MIVNEGWLTFDWAESLGWPLVLPQLVLLHEECFPHENWEEENFLKFVGHRVRHNAIKILTVEGTGRVLGALLYTVSDEDCRIRRIAVAPELRRQGYGRHMVRALVGPYSLLRRDVITARVHERNVVGQYFIRDALRVTPPLGLEWTPAIQGSRPCFTHTRGDTDRDDGGELRIWFRLNRKVASSSRRAVALTA